MISMIAASCEDESFIDNKLSSETGEGNELCTIAFSTTRGTGDADDYTAHTYRTRMFYRSLSFSRLDSLITPYQGTYCDPKPGNTWLTPCAVNANFSYDATANPAEGSEYGMRAGLYHDYYLVINSPASQYVKYDEIVKKNPLNLSQTAILEYWGLPYERDGAQYTHPAVSPVANVTVRGVNVNDYYIYNLGSTMELTEYRSGMAFSVRCGDAISHARLKKVEISGLRGKAVYQPFTQDFFFDETNDLCEYEKATVYECPEDDGVNLIRGGTEGSYTEGESISLTGANTYTHLDDTETNDYYTYILSGDYKSLDKNNFFINTPPNLCLTLVTDEGVPITVDPVPMGFVFEPQKYYYFMITINSVYLAIQVTARPWGADDEQFEVNEEVEGDSEPLTYNFTISNWTEREFSDSVENGEGGGGDTPASIDAEGVTVGDWNPLTGDGTTHKGGDSNVE